MRVFSYALATTLLISMATIDSSYAQSTDCTVTGISSEDAPPPLPVYNQPPIPAPGYIWTPGYWAWNNDDYYWVPGTWVEPPEAGVLWTPPYWGFVNGAYVFHRGYWGPHVGFYGGVDYGYGYGGRGFEGGHWDNGAFYYNRAVTNLQGARITNVYEKTVVIHNDNRISYNGGRGGLMIRPTPAEEAVGHEAHVPPTRWQTQHVRAASVNSAGFASTNHGHPAVGATPRPLGAAGQPGPAGGPEGRPEGHPESHPGIPEANPVGLGAGHAPHEPQAHPGGANGAAPMPGERPLNGSHLPPKPIATEPAGHPLAPGAAGKPVRERPQAPGGERPAGALHGQPLMQQHRSPGAGAPPHALPPHALPPHPAPMQAPHREPSMHMEAPGHQGAAMTRQAPPHHEAAPPHREAPAGHPPGHEGHEGDKKHPGDR
jgi:hypothetical protein